MELYRNNLIIFFLISFILSSNNSINAIENISLIDFCKLKKSESQFNIGLQKNNPIKSFYFSIDKLISHNLTGSIKISLLRNNVLEIYNQNSFLFNMNNSPLNFLISINYLTNNFKITKWFNIGIVFDLFENHNLLDDNFFIGAYSDIDTNNKEKNNFNYYFRIEKEVKKNVSFSLSTRYLVKDKKFNSNLELIIRI